MSEKKKKTGVEVKIINPVSQKKSPGIIVHEGPKTKEGAAVKNYEEKEKAGFASWVPEEDKKTTGKSTTKSYSGSSYYSSYSSYSKPARSPGEPLTNYSTSYPTSTAAVAYQVLLSVIIFLVKDDYGECRFEVELEDGYKCSDLLSKIEKVKPDFKWEVAGEDMVPGDSEDLWTLEEIESCFHEEVESAEALLKPESES